MYVANDLSDSLQQKYRKLLQDVDIRHEIQGEVFNGKWGIEQRTSDEGITKAKTVWRVICRDQEGKECHNLVEPDRKDPLRPKDLFGIFSSEGSETGDSLVLPSWLRDHTQMYKSIQAAKRSIKSYQVKKERARQAQADASEELSTEMCNSLSNQPFDTGRGRGAPNSEIAGENCQPSLTHRWTGIMQNYMASESDLPRDLDSFDSVSSTSDPIGGYTPEASVLQKCSNYDVPRGRFVNQSMFDRKPIISTVTPDQSNLSSNRDLFDEFTHLGSQSSQEDGH